MNFSHCVPTILTMLLDAVDGAGDSQRSPRPWAMLVGGAPLSSSLAERASTFGITAVAGYGMSEAGPAVAIARSLALDPQELGRGGYALPLMQTRLDQSEGPEGGDAGELTLRAPWLAPAYTGQKEASDALWRGGWMHTQDVARYTEGGEIEIVDRLKDVIKTGGEWLSSPQLEEIAVLSPAVSAAAFVGVPDERWGERPVAFLVVRPDMSTDLEGLRSHMAGFVERGLISRYALPDQVIVLDQLPTTSVGKIDKKALRAMAPC